MARCEMGLKEATKYFHESMDELEMVLAKVQDAWFLVEERNGDNPVYGEEYPFEKDFGEVMLDVYAWHKACKKESKAMLEADKWEELPIDGWWHERSE